MRTTVVAGSPTDMGRRHGFEHAEEIREYCDDRIRLSAEGTNWSRDQIIDLGEQMLPAHAAFDERLYQEMLAMAEMARLSPGEAVIIGGYTDFIDTVRSHAGSAPVEDSCTAVIVPDQAAVGPGGFLAQTWDMHASATPHVVMFDVRPDSGPSSLVFTTVGTLGQIGLNEAGIAIGINNLTADDGKLGVTWPFVVRKALAQTSFDDAMTVILDADLAGGHNFLLFDALGNGASIEAMPTATHVQKLDGEVLAHTNHCLVPATQAVEGQRPDELGRSSDQRLIDAARLLQGRPVTREHVVDMLRDEGSICRHPAPPFDYESCGAMVMRPATGEVWACWGIPTQSEFEYFTTGDGS